MLRLGVRSTVVADVQAEGGTQSGSLRGTEGGLTETTGLCAIDLAKKSAWRMVESCGGSRAWRGVHNHKVGHHVSHLLVMTGAAKLPTEPAVQEGGDGGRELAGIWPPRAPRLSLGRKRPGLHACALSPPAVPARPLQMAHWDHSSRKATAPPHLPLHHQRHGLAYLPSSSSCSALDSASTCPPTPFPPLLPAHTAPTHTTHTTTHNPPIRMPHHGSHSRHAWGSMQSLQNSHSHMPHAASEFLSARGGGEQRSPACRSCVLILSRSLILVQN